MKKVLISFFVVGVIISLGIIGSKYFNNGEDLNNNESLISYYVETGEGTGVYEKQESTTWPEGYVLNEEKSTCDNGSTLSWDSGTNSVIVTANKEDSCKVYLDVLVLHALQFNYQVSNAMLEFYFSLNEERLTDGQIVQYKKGDILLISPTYQTGTTYIYDDNNRLINEIKSDPYCETITLVLTGDEAKIVGPSANLDVAEKCFVRPSSP